MFPHSITRITRIAALSLALAAAAAPAASAAPLYDARNPDNRVPDMHASVARAAAEEREKQNLLNPDTRDFAEGRGTYNSPDVVVVETAAEPVSSGGIDWEDAGIGAGSLMGIGLLALGGTLIVTHRRSVPGLGR